MMIYDLEKIGITRIILRQPQVGVQAVLSGFFEANRTLAAWLACANAPSVCDFEIVYADGSLLRGEYEPRRRGRDLPSLNSFILRRNLVSSAFLKQYELSDAPKVGRKFVAAQGS